jgi:phage/plasmid-associated DNA primase
MKKLSKLQRILGIKEEIKFEHIMKEDEMKLRKLKEQWELEKRHQGKNMMTNEEIEKKEKEFKEKAKRVINPEEFVKEIMEKKNYVNKIKYYPKTGEYFLYEPHEGIYKMVTPAEFGTLMGNMIITSPLQGKVDSIYYAEKVVNVLKATEMTHLGLPELSWDYLILSNGALNLKTKEFLSYNPEIFMTTKVYYEYKPGETCPKFMEFIKRLTGGHEDRINLLRSWMHTVLTMNKKAQVFLYLYGPAGAGKTMFANYLAALIGRERVIYTSLKNLNTDRFETYNLRFKALINITDAERYEADVPILKQIVGSDPINANAKYVQGSIEIKRIGNLMIVSNHPFKSKDNSAALMRRLIPFKVTAFDKYKSDGVPLLEPTDGGFIGPGLHELPGILNWVLSFTEQESLKILSNVEKYVSSLKDVIIQAKNNINPLSSWVEEHLRYQSGSHILFGLKGAKTDTLYGHYSEFCIREGITILTPRRFREDLENYLLSKKEFYHVITKRTNLGLALFNVVLSDMNDKLNEGIDIQEEENIHPKPICLPEVTSQVISNDQSTKQEDTGFRSVSEWYTEVNDTSEDDMSLNESIQKRHAENQYTWAEEEVSNEIKKIKERAEPNNKKRGEKDKEDSLSSSETSIPEQEYREKYLRLIGIKYNKQGKELRELGKNLLNQEDVEYIYKMKRKGMANENGTAGFMEKKKNRIIMEINKLNTFGLFVEEYTNMGASARIQPLEPTAGNSIIACSREVRNHGFFRIKKRLDSFFQGQGLLMDLDLQSCYVNLLLGLYPKQSENFGKLIEKGIWNSIYDYFKKQGKEALYNKAWVKVCVYSSYFQGGSKAMMSSILEKEREAHGMSTTEFQKWSGYGSLKAQVGLLVKEMMSTDIILAIREASQNIIKYSKEIGHTLLSHTSNQTKSCALKLTNGEYYKFIEMDFKNGFANVLQDYEFYLVSKTILDVVKIYPNLLVIGHFHDGITIYIPEMDLNKKDYDEIRAKQAVLEDINKVLGKHCDTLNLAKRSVFETKEIVLDA